MLATPSLSMCSFSHTGNTMTALGCTRRMAATVWLSAFGRLSAYMFCRISRMTTSGRSGSSWCVQSKKKDASTAFFW